MGWLTDILKEVPLSAVLRERVTEAERKIKETQEENRQLKERIVSLEEKNKTLREELKAHCAPRINRDCGRVLEFLANQSSGTQAAHTGYNLKLSVAEVEHCFDQLREAGLIRQSRADMGQGAYYAATPAGRAYLFKS